MENDYPVSFCIYPNNETKKLKVSERFNELKKELSEKEGYKITNGELLEMLVLCFEKKYFSNKENNNASS